jgi:ribosomal-protein-alanine N-acetyltransferase
MGANYRAGGMTFIASGAVDHASIVRLVEEQFAGLSAGAGRRRSRALCRFGHPRFDEDLEQVHVTYAFPGVASDDPDIYAAQVYATALGGGMSSRLFQEAREKRGLCYSIYAFAQASTDTGMIGVYTGTGEAEAGEISAVVAGEMAALAEGATEVEVARAKAQMKSGMLMGLERPSSRTEQIASNLLAYGRVLSVEELTAKLDAVDAEAVRRFGDASDELRQFRHGSRRSGRQTRKLRFVCGGALERVSPVALPNEFGADGIHAGADVSRRPAAGHQGRERLSALSARAGFSLPGRACAARAASFSCPWEPSWATDELSKGAFRRRLKKYQRETRLDSAYAFFVFRTEDNALLGGCTLSNVRSGVTQCCALGYWVGERFARQGYMFDAVRALVPFIFKTLGLHRIEAACLPSNDPSKSLLGKVGFREEGLARRYLQINGEWQDHVLFALLADEARLG